MRVAGSGFSNMSDSSSRARPSRVEPSNGSPSSAARANRVDGSWTEWLAPNTSTKDSRTQEMPSRFTFIATPP